MTGTYEYFLVALSYVVAVVASYLALGLCGRVATTQGRSAKLWLTAGAFSVGCGIWTMHFVGMLAFKMPIRFAYDIPITIVSFLVCVAASLFTIFVASRKTNSPVMICLSGVILGCGIAGMHYTGMADMSMEAEMIYSPLLVAASLVFSVLAAIAVIWIAFTLAHIESTHLGKLQIGAALVMGVAICGMHFSGMATASYLPLEGAIISPSVEIHQTGKAVALAVAALLILGFTHLTIFFDYNLGAQKDFGDKLAEMVEARAAELKAQTEDLRQSKEKLEREALERERAEKEANYLSQVLDESTNEIYVFDADTLHFISTNKGAETNSGYDKSEFESLTPLDLKPNYDRASFEEVLEPLRSGKLTHSVFETSHRRKDSSTYPVWVHLQAFNVNDRSVFAASITDITEQQKLEEQLLQARKLESIGQLAAGIAHEINTPAQFVTDNLRFMKDSFEDINRLNQAYVNLFNAARDGNVAAEVLEKVKNAVKEADPDYLFEEIPSALTQSLEGITHVSNIVRAMKEFSHPGGKERKLIDFNKIIASTITVASNEWKYVAEIETDLDDDLPMVPCLSQEITQVVLNLIVNASHAIADTLDESKGEKGVIRICTKVLNEQVELTITDNGSGIPKKVQDRIFDPFFTTKEVGKGTGQGLSMAYITIVEKHQGTLSFESEEGKGTKFIVRLPLNLPNTQEAA
jgi:PAS domain S-box-containing protein